MSISGIACRSSGEPWGPPPGEDPVAYAVLMVVFGTALLVARISTGSIWTGVGLHLAFLRVNRVVLFGDARGAGWSAELVSQDAVLLVPAYLLSTAALIPLARRVIAPNGGSRSPTPAES